MNALTGHPVILLVTLPDAGACKRASEGLNMVLVEWPTPPPITLTHHAAHIWYVSKSVQSLKFLIQFLEQLHVSFPGVHDFLQWQGVVGGGLEFIQADNHSVVSGNTLPLATLKKKLFSLKDSLL